MTLKLALMSMHIVHEILFVPLIEQVVDSQPVANKVIGAVSMASIDEISKKDAGLILRRDITPMSPNCIKNLYG